MKHTIRMQTPHSTLIHPVCVEAETPIDAIRVACDYVHPCGEAMPAKVFPGHDGWYQDSEAVWVGEITWDPGYTSGCRLRERGGPSHQLVYVPASRTYRWLETAAA